MGLETLAYTLPKVTHFQERENIWSTNLNNRILLLAQY